MNSVMLWAKKTAENDAEFHPLICHLMDVAAVTRELLLNRFPEGKRIFPLQFFNYSNPSDVHHGLILTAALHDIGKASAAFQKKSTALSSRLQQAGYSFEGLSSAPRDVLHNHISHALLMKNQLPGFSDWFTTDATKLLAEAVGGHHGTFAYSVQINRISDPTFGSQTWHQARHHIYAQIEQVICQNCKPPEPIDLSSNADRNVLRFWLAGLITHADWIASDTNYFPFFTHSSAIDEFNPEVYWLQATDNAAKALDSLGFFAAGQPGGLPAFGTLFPGYTQRPQQVAIMQKVTELTEPVTPMLLLVEAPMGTGKTETAFVCSELFNAKSAQQGGYVAMPTQATSNQMYRRYREFLHNRHPEGYQAAFQLLHSASSLFLADYTMPLRPENIADDETKGEPAIEAHAWFSQKKRGLLAPFAVGTIDQILLAVLMAKHNYLRLYGISCKTIILDEVHSYDVYMSTLLEHLLRWAARLHISVILLSATLPQSTRAKLIKAYTGGTLSAGAGYPRFTLAGAGKHYCLPLPPSGTKTIKLNKLHAPASSRIIEQVTDTVRNGGCLAVICNTVRRAQQLYQEYRATGSVQAILLHARFPRDRRLELENSVVRQLSKDGIRPERLVVFTTQIIEQSLDIDFDYMISELCPVDLLLQRVGRLHRHERMDGRPALLQEPELCCLLPDAGVFHSGQPCTLPYETAVIFRSYHSLLAVSSINLPTDIEILIEQVYGEKFANPDPEIQQTDTRLQQSANERKEKDEQFAKFKLIDAPGAEPGEQYTLFDEEDPLINPQVAALTRLTPPSVIVACVLCDNNQQVLADLQRTEFSEDAPVTDAFVRAVTAASVSLSGMAIFNQVTKSGQCTRPKSWNRHPALRYLYVVRFTAGSCQLGGRSLLYDENLGIVYGSHEDER